jgi:hypothetical protein
MCNSLALAAVKPLTITNSNSNSNINRNNIIKSFVIVTMRPTMLRCIKVLGARSCGRAKHRLAGKGERPADAPSPGPSTMVHHRHRQTAHSSNETDGRFLSVRNDAIHDCQK